MNHICGDSRYAVIQKAKDKLLEATNIGGSQDEMNVLDSLLYRAWQMGWLKQYEPDYKERMKDEYWQLKDRYNKLHNMCIKYEAGTLDFEPTCSLELLTKQMVAMGEYLYCLEVRAQVEGIML